MGTYVRTQSIDHVVGERGSVTLTIISGELRARGVPGAEAHIRATFEISASSDGEADRIFDEVQLRVRRAGDELSVEERDVAPSVGAVISRLFGGRGSYDLSLEAEIPAAAQLRLAGVSSDMEVSGFHGEQRYGTVSGDLRLTELGGSVRLDTVSGDAIIRADLPLSIQVKGVSGDVSITAPTLRGLQANTVSGDVEVEAELAASGEFRVETVSGDLVVGLVGGATFEVHGLSTDVSSELDHRLEGQVDRRRLIIGGGGPRLVFNSMSGDVDVRRPSRIREGAMNADAVAPPPTAPSQATQLEILQALERGEIDVDEAARRLSGGT